MKTPWLSSCFVLAVPALVVACSGAAGTSLTDYVQPSESAETTDASATSTPASTSPATSPTVSTTTPTSAADAGSSASDGGDGDASTAISCPYTGTPLPTSSFAACGAGAVCAPAALIPTASQADFATCKTGLCVPTKVLAAYGNYLPKTCTSLEGAEGRCLNQVLPSVAPQVSELPQDVCDSDESCVPCFSPLDGTSTGACNTVSCDAPKEKPVEFAGCCYWENTPAGRCVPTSAAGSAVSSLTSDGCTGGDVCAPEENLEPSFQPVFCSNDDNFIYSYTGFCVSNCIPQASDLLGEGTCDGAHYCAPCHDPLSGEPTNVPGCVY